MPNGVEPQPMEFDVGRIVRDYQGKFLGTSPNLAMPGVMILLFAELETLTQQLEERNAARGVVGDQLDIDVGRWRVRLDNYVAENGKAPNPADREAILWTVTAPLLLGWFGGPTGVEVPLPAGGFPPGFNTEMEHGADVGTPFSLANQLGVFEDWEVRRTDLLLEDIEAEAKKTATSVATVARSYWPYLLGGAAAVGVVGVLAYMQGKKAGGVDIRVGNGRALPPGR